jgi:hypothetical protein
MNVSAAGIEMQRGRATKWMTNLEGHSYQSVQVTRSAPHQSRLCMAAYWVANSPKPRA